jgi:hypothetical protein
VVEKRVECLKPHPIGDPISEYAERFVVSDSNRNVVENRRLAIVVDDHS